MEEPHKHGPTSHTQQRITVSNKYFIKSEWRLFAREIINMMARLRIIIIIIIDVLSQ